MSEKYVMLKLLWNNLQLLKELKRKPDKSLNFLDEEDMISYLLIENDKYIELLFVTLENQPLEILEKINPEFVKLYNDFMKKKTKNNEIKEEEEVIVPIPVKIIQKKIPKVVKNEPVKKNIVKEDIEKKIVKEVVKEVVKDDNDNESVIDSVVNSDGEESVIDSDDESVVDSDDESVVDSDDESVVDSDNESVDDHSVEQFIKSNITKTEDNDLKLPLKTIKEAFEKYCSKHDIDINSEELESTLIKEFGKPKGKKIQSFRGLKINEK